MKINPDTGKPVKTHEFCHNRRQAKLEDAADRLLAKAGYFQQKAEEEIVLDADCCGTHGLRPTWHGRAS